MCRGLGAPATRLTRHLLLRYQLSPPLARLAGPEVRRRAVAMEREGGIAAIGFVNSLDWLRVGNNWARHSPAEFRAYNDSRTVATKVEIRNGTMSLTVFASRAVGLGRQAWRVAYAAEHNW